MIIVNIIGGLGNQLFQYAFYKWLENQNIKAAIDVSYFDNYQLHNGFDLMNAFLISPVFAAPEEVKEYIHGFSRSRNVYALLRKKYFQIFDRQLLFDRVVKWEYRNKQKNQKFLTLRKAYLIGYWAKEDYLKNFRDYLTNDLVFTCEENLDEKNKDLQMIVNSENTLCLHLRGGDYDMTSRLDSFYYSDAIGKVLEKKTISKIIVFTNDRNYTKSVLGELHYEIVDHNQGRNSFLDMYLMTKAKNLIIANSTFSWWAAYLNTNASMVFYPRGSFGVALDHWEMI